MITVVALVATCVVALAAIYVCFHVNAGRERSWERKEQSWNQERRLLLNRIMFLADKPWEMPETFMEEPEVYDSTIVLPEQMVQE